MEAKMMMRKAFWCGLFVVVAAATGVYWAADFCQRHPDSALVHYAGAVCQGEQGMEPIRRPGQTAAVSDRSFDPPAGIAEPGPCAASGLHGQPPVESVQAAEREQDALPPAPIDLTVLALASGKSEGVPESGGPELLPSPAVPLAVHDEIVLTTVGPVATPGDEDAYRVMPPCLDDDKDVPATMPYAVDCAGPMPLCGSDCTPTPRSRHFPAAAAPSQPSPVMSLPVTPLQQPITPLIDTTEFRPSDARKGEFERSPL